MGVAVGVGEAVGRAVGVVEGVDVTTMIIGVAVGMKVGGAFTEIDVASIVFGIDGVPKFSPKEKTRLKPISSRKITKIKSSKMRIREKFNCLCCLLP